MKKKKVIISLLIVTVILLTGCNMFTCKKQGCNEKDIYKDGYCKYHYGINEGEEMIKDIINNW